MGKEDFQKVKVWAVVGATADEEKYGYKVFAHLIQKGYTVYPISLKYDFIGERKAYTSLYELPEKPDAVNLIVNPKAVMESIHDCARLGIQKDGIQPGSESPEILEYAEQNGIEAVQGCVLREWP